MRAHAHADAHVLAGAHTPPPRPGRGPKHQSKRQYGVSDVRFRVVAEDGKAKLKAIPIK